MKREHEAVFLQSLRDFPCPVTLGKNTPVFGLHRFKYGLRFVPLDDEGFTLRGDKQRLLYKGRRRSHRFTILGDTAFEYDCILEKEPETNVITLYLEGAENFDFFKQPYFEKEPFLRGSYAVYKKETLLGEGTGKLCHIHRPEIIDAKGLRCWGDLNVAGNKLRITIPDWFLSVAKYPVIVDPTIGTSTVGGQIYGVDPNNSNYDKPYLDNGYALNKYLVPQNGNGTCTAYVYCYSDDTDSRATPILYTNESNKPYMKKSKNENEIDVRVFTPSKPAGWRSNTFNINGNITTGEYVWFGVYSSWFVTRFDYGGECYKGYFDWGRYEEYDGEPTPYIYIGKEDILCTIKWSFYFDYTGITSQNYKRVLTQGVKLTDNRKINGNYKRVLSQITAVKSTLFKIAILFRQCFIIAQNSMNISRKSILLRNIYKTCGSIAETKHKANYYKFLTDKAQATGIVFRGLLLFVRILTKVFIRDFLLGRFLNAREELFLKSCTVREIVLESRIN